MKHNPRTTGLLLLSLLLLLVSTRLGHVMPFALPDASWAVFILGGYHLRRASIFLGLFCAAVLVDVSVIAAAAVAAACISWGYAALLPAYAALWYGGYALSHSSSKSGVLWYLRCVLGIVLCVGVAFAISNAGFYWGNAASGGTDPWTFVRSVTPYYPIFLSTTFAYVLSVSVVLEVFRRFVKGRDGRDTPALFAKRR